MPTLPRALTSFLLRRYVAGILLAGCCALLTGCRALSGVYPVPQRRTISELYFEALAASQNVPDRNGAIPVSHGGPTVLPPVTDESIPELTPLPATTIPDADTNPQHIEVPELPLSSRHDSRQSGWKPRNTGRAPGNATQDIRTVSHSRTEPVVTVTELFEDTDIRQALQSIASQAGVTVIVDEQVGGVVSAVIENEPFEDALRKLLLPLGLVWKKLDNGEYLVGLADPSTPMFDRLAERTEYRPAHLSPEELSSLLPERDRKFVQVVDARNRILIEAPREIGTRILQRLEQLDTPIPQVELEAIVCVVSPDSGFRSGLDWNHALTLNGSELFNFGLAGLAFTAKGSGAGFNNVFSDFAVTSAFVKLLAQEGYLAIRAAPRVTARDGDQARIAITQESYFSTQPQSNQAFFRQEIKQVDAGIELDITPIIRGDNITVKIEKAEVSEDIRTSQINSSITENPFPRINRRTVSTTVHVRDGETIVIGGLVQRQSVDRIAKVPVLGDVPVLGRLFQTVEQKEQDAEVVIFISPRLVRPGPAPVME